MSTVENNPLRNYVITGNQFIGHDNEVPNWSSGGIVIVQGFTSSTVGGYGEIILVNAGDYEALLANNEFTSNAIDLTHQDWTNGLVELFVYPEEDVQP